jgi:hypothetical protein
LPVTFAVLAQVISACYADPAVAAVEPPPDLHALKAGLRRGLLTVVIPEMKAHRAELLTLEHRLAESQDYAGAIKARDEGNKLAKHISVLEQEEAILASRPAVDNAARVAARIELNLGNARLEGAQYDSAEGALTGWGGEHPSATWQLPDLPPGGYEVLIRCSGPGGAVVVKEAFYSLASSCKSPSDKNEEQNLGTLRIRSGAGSLVLEAGPGWKVYSVALAPSAL